MTYTTPASDRAAKTRPNGDHLVVVFGYMSTDWAGAPEFRVAHGKPSKSYKTAAGAKRAINGWVAQ